MQTKRVSSRQPQTKKKRNLFKIRKGTKYKALYRALLAKFNDAKSKGQYVDLIGFGVKDVRFAQEEMKRLIRKNL